MTTAPHEVIILNDYASVTGGSTAVAVASALELAARDVRVTLFTCVGPVAAELQDVPNLEVICLGQAEIAKNRNRFQAFAQGWRNRAAVDALRTLLRGKPRDRTVVHAHTWTKALSPFALEAVTRLGFKLVVTLHDFFIACPNGGFFVHGENELCRRVPLSAACWACNCDRRNYAHKLWRGARTVIQNRILRIPAKVSGFIGVSEFSLRLLRPDLPATTPARVIRNPVDVPASAADGRVRAEENREFLFVGRFEVEKGVRLFAEAVQTSGLKATFVGDGAELAAVRRMCPGATFTGWLPPAEIRRRLRRARALVFPPLWYETLGLVVIEAAAAGVPAIVSDQCAATDHVVDCVTGLHFAHGSAGALAGKMWQLADNDGLTARLSQLAHEWYWREPWTRARHVGELLGFYAEIAGGVEPSVAKGGIYESAGRDRAGR